MTTDNRTQRDKYVSRWSALKTERSSFDTHWRDISDYLLPRSARFTSSDHGKSRRHNNIYDSTGTRCLRVLAAGMMAGMTSPARPWFRLTMADPDLTEYAPVKEWLFKVGSLMRDIYARSNTYRSLHSMYEELGGFGTGATIVSDNFKNVQHMHTMTVGEYAIAADYEGNSNTLYREFELTVAQVVAEYGIENVSLTVKNLHDTGKLESYVRILHLIEPRIDRDSRKRDSKNMPWASCTLELGADDGKTLRESGFNEFSVLAPRWALTSGDTYGHSPGMEALGDIKQLQHEQLRKAECIDYQTKPPVQVPAALKNQGVDLLPGGVSYYDATGPNGGIRSAFEVRLDLSHMLEDIRDVRERIGQSFYTDLFMMLANDARSGITATEVAERHEEKLLMLGPVLERLHNELLNPMIEMTFSKMVRAGILPTPPKELQGDNLNVEFVSTLAQAQRAVAVGNMDRYVNSLGAISAVKPAVLDKLDADQYADVLAEALGIDPSLVVSDDKVVLIRQARAQAAQQANQADQMEQRSNTIRNLASAKTGEGNALDSVMAATQG